MMTDLLLQRLLSRLQRVSNHPADNQQMLSSKTKIPHRKMRDLYYSVLFYCVKSIAYLICAVAV